MLSQLSLLNLMDLKKDTHLMIIEELLMRAMNQNFIPVVDDRNLFIGIVTRKDVIKHFYERTFDYTEDIDLIK